MLYNRESRAAGKQPNPWNQRRVEHDRVRRMRKAAGATGSSVVLAEIAERDGWTCHVCSRPVHMDVPWPNPASPSLDHVIPLCRGGLHDPSNVRLTHLRCNLVKGSKLAVDLVPAL